MWQKTNPINVSKADITKTKYNPEKANKAKIQPGLVASYDTRPGSEPNEVDLFGSAPEPTRGTDRLRDRRTWCNS